ncbi:uncharacterized protein CEXT_623731 [Caerostris extrusa]|uniref:Gustatory receptor n=1 Tax=Caerostris extrusa TaxID=172846 RepID=A0AAV4Y3D0_CAEEX|nr:uncharacterized protein CEXT_623731 [Caerostris extrusa]
MRIRAFQEIRSSIHIPKEFKEICVALSELRNTLTLSTLYILSMYFSGYFCLNCSYINLLFAEFISQSQKFITRPDYQITLQLYHELTETVTSMDNFLCYSTFINVLADMIGVFWACYVLVFEAQDDWQQQLYFLIAIIVYSAWLLMIMLPGSVVNQNVEVAKGAILSCPGWYPNHYNELKTCVRTKFKQKKATLTLWKIYYINKSLLISSLGSLVTYGILFGTLGTVQNSGDVDVYNASKESS